MTHFNTNGSVTKRYLANPENLEGFSSTKGQGKNWTSGKGKGREDCTIGSDDTLGGLELGHEVRVGKGTIETWG